MKSSWYLDIFGVYLSVVMTSLSQQSDHEPCLQNKTIWASVKCIDSWDVIINNSTPYNFVFFSLTAFCLVTHSVTWIIPSPLTAPLVIINLSQHSENLKVVPKFSRLLQGSTSAYLDILKNHFSHAGATYSTTTQLIHSPSLHWYYFWEWKSLKDSAEQIASAAYHFKALQNGAMAINM